MAYTNTDGTRNPTIDTQLQPPELDARVKVQQKENLSQKTKDWKDIKENILPVDFLLMTVRDFEFEACLTFLKCLEKSYHMTLGYVYFGDIGSGKKKMKVAVLRSDMGSSTPGGSLVSVRNAVPILKPRAVFYVGICAGLKKEKVELGDVVVCQELVTYSSIKQTEKGIEDRNVKVPLRKNLSRLIKHIGEGWKPPLENPASLKVKVCNDGMILSGPEVVNDKNRRAELIERVREATAIECEGEGLFAAAYDLDIEWCVIKGVSDYADGKKSESDHWRPFASIMAASLVAHTLKDVNVFKYWPHFEDEDDSDDEESSPRKRRRSSSPSSISGSKRNKGRASDSIPSYVRARGPMALEAYWRALKEGETYDRRTKIVLIGQDRVGKTSLRRYLRGEAFNKDESSTDGIEMIPPVKNAGKGAWKNPDQLENTSALDHKCAEEVTKRILSTFTERSDRAQNERRKREKKTRGEPTRGKKAIQDRSSHHLARDRDPLMISPSNEHAALNPRHPDDTSEEVTPSSGIKDVKIETKPDKIPEDVASLIERGLEGNDSLDSEGIWPVVWDFAGQAVYHAIHPIFLSQEAIYVLVSDLTMEVWADAHCRIRPRNHDEIEVESPHMEDTNLDHMMRWLDLVQSLGKLAEFQKNSANTMYTLPRFEPLTSLPPVVLVGTHADRVTNPSKEMESLKRTIYRMASSATLKHISEESFYIDNTNTNREDDPQIVSLRAELLETAKRMPHINKIIPLQWLRVEKKIHEMVRDKGIHYVGKNRFKEDIAGDICRFKRKDDVEELLHFLQARGSVIYQDLPEDPDGLVVLDPQWLIQILCEIVTVSPEWKNDPAIQKEYTVLREKGLLSRQLLNRAFKNLKLEDIKDSLIHVMEKFDVICDSKNCRGKEYSHFVPCMLKLQKKKTRGTSMRNGPLPVFLTFNTNYVPSGLFCRLVVHFWEWASQLCGPGIAPALFSNVARFNVSEEYQLTLECHKTVIQLQIWTLRKPDEKEEKRICEELLSHLERSKTRLSVTCPWLRSVTMELFVKCQLCEPCLDKCHEGTNICILHKEKVCSHFNCGHYIPLRSPGLSCEHSADDVPDYPAEKLAPWVQALKSIEHKKKIGTSTEHLDRTSLKRRNNEPPLCEAPACKERKTSLQGLPVKAGKPTKDELEALSLKIGDKWERLGRRLGFDEADLVAFDEDNRQLTKKAYRMLMAWKGKEGSKGTYLVLYNALCHKFVGRKDLAEAFCCEKIEGNGSN